VPLEEELAYFERRLPEWLQIYPGHFVVIKGDEFLGSFSTSAEALAAGVKAYGTQAFLIRQVTEHPPITYNPALVVGTLFARP
jgi:hypothetical protein